MPNKEKVATKKATIRKNFPFKIGADPEFNMLIDNKHFNAKNVMKNMFANKLTENDDGYMLNKVGEIGWDGNDDIAELRPLPEKTPEKLIKNLKAMFQEITKENSLLDLSTLSDMGAVGGHMHFELPPNMPNSTTESISRKMASFYIPLLLGEDKLNIKIREKSNYGNITDYNYEQKGRAHTFEFRAPSAEWLTTEKIAYATMAYMATIFNEIVYQPKNFAKCNGLIFKNNAQANSLKNLAMTDFKIIMESLTDKIKKYVSTFEFYKQYKKEIDFILSIEKIKKEKKEVEYNIATGWNMIKHKQPNKRELFSKIKQSKNAPNYDEITELITIEHNPDTNISIFVQQLKLKIARFNWKLKNRYFIFGLKKGINDFIIIDKNFSYISGQDQIKTQTDFDLIENTLLRMNDKFPYIKKRNQRQNKKTNENYILIGVPYHMRIKTNTRPFLETIYNLEKNKIETTNKTTIINSLHTDKKKTTEIGKITKIYEKSQEIENLQSDNRRIENAESAMSNAEYDLEYEQQIREDVETRDSIPVPISAVRNTEIRSTRIIDTIGTIG